MESQEGQDRSRSPEAESPRRSARLTAKPLQASVALGGPCSGQGVLNVQQDSVVDITRRILDRVCLPLQTLVLRGRPVLRVARAQPSVGSPRGSRFSLGLCFFLPSVLVSVVLLSFFVFLVLNQLGSPAVDLGGTPLDP